MLLINPYRFGSAYDPDAQDYFTRAEGLGGSFDLTSISGTYTTNYVKTAISNFVAGLKTDGVWASLDEVYLLAGVTFGGLLAKLKHGGTASMTNNGPLVTGDYVAAGSGAGIKGNGSSKYLTTGFTVVSVNDVCLGGYVTGLNTTAGRYYIGFNATAGLGIGSEQVAGQWRIFESPSGTNVSTHQTGSFVATRRGVNDIEFYSRGASILTDTDTTAGTTGTVAILAIRDDGNLPTNGRLSLAFAGTGISDTDAANIETRSHALMTAIGANPY